VDLAYQEDIPSQKPQFETELVARALAAVLLKPASSATVLGVHGPWGSGKTTLLEALRRQLKQQLGNDKSIFIWFNAWKFQDRESLWRALILHVLAQLQEHGADDKQVKELQQSLYLAFAVEEKGPWKINWRTLIVEIISILLSVVKLGFVARALKSSGGWLARLFLSDKDENGNEGDGKDDDEDAKHSPLDRKRVEKLAAVLERETVERQVVRVESIEQFLENFQSLVKNLTDAQRQIFIFVDDLDRCLPESALQIFESIKLFMDAPGCRYALALDRDVIRKGLAVRYTRVGEAAQGQVFIDADEYIEKTISVSYDLARLSPADAVQLIDSFQMPLAIKQSQKELIILALGTNPRRLKRFMNTLALQMHLADLSRSAGGAIPIDADFSLFLKVQLVAYRYSGVFSVVLSDPPLLRRLLDINAEYQRDVQAGDAIAARESRNNKVRTENPLISPLQTAEDFWRLMALDPPIPDEPQTVAKIQSWFRYRSPV
jgi:hypothetical protein